MRPTRDAVNTQCDYCGLPIPAWLVRRSDTQRTERHFCCVGCRIASSITSSRGAEGEAQLTLTRLGIAIFLTMNVMVFAMALWSRDVYAGPGPAPGSFEEIVTQLFRYLSMMFAVPVVFLLGKPVLETAYHALRAGAITTDLLIILGVGASCVYSAISVLRGAGHIYFEVACLVLVLLTLGRWLEATGKLKTSEALESLSRLLPDQVRLADEGPTHEGPGHVVPSHMVPRESVTPGAVIRVLPGERFAVDGRIIRGTAEIDEQIVTGESHPVRRGVGDPVLSGTLNLDGDVSIRVTARAGEETLSRLVSLVRAAREAKGHYQRVADRLASVFVPTVCVIACVAAAYHTVQSGAEAGIQTGLAVVLIACPCALGLATPMAVWTAMGRAARRQVLFQSGEALERLARVHAVRFDKTGTLTTGVATVERVVMDAEDYLETAGSDNSIDTRDVLAHAAAIAPLSKHPFAQAVFEHVGVVSETPPLERFESIAGKGIRARLVRDGANVLLGSVTMMRGAGQGISPAIDSAILDAQAFGSPITCLALREHVCCVFILQETLRPHAAETLKLLKRAGLDVAVLTGDHRERASRLAESLGVAVQSDLLPEGKVAAIEKAKKLHGVVAMVGDGVNDAPALATADVGIALGCGADLARESAAVCLLGDQLDRIPWSIDLARMTVRLVKQNLFWAFAYNVFGIGLAAAGALNPIVAAVGMSLSSFLVVTNSLRLRGPHVGKTEQRAETAEQSAEAAEPRLDEKSAMTATLTTFEIAAERKNPTLEKADGRPTPASVVRPGNQPVETTPP